MPALADSVADVADADIIQITVLNDAQVRDVVGELGRHTPSPAPSSRFTPPSATLPPSNSPPNSKPQGIHVVDAPVSGGGRGRAKGELATMVGADDEVFERIKGRSRTGRRWSIHAGRAGRGHPNEVGPQHADLHLLRRGVGEAMKLAEAAGLDLQALGKVVRHTDALTSGPGAIMVRDRHERP